MRIAVATLYTEGYRSLGELTNPHKIEYCTRHGYTPELKYLSHDPNRRRKAAASGGAFGDYNRDGGGNPTDPPDAHWAPAYERYEHVLDLLSSGRYDAVFICGADALIMNQALTVERLIPDENVRMVVTTDCNRFNDDNYIAVNNDLTKQFLWQMTREGGAQYEYQKHPCGFMEPYGCQAVARDYLSKEPYMRNVLWVPQHEMNSNLNREEYGFPPFVQGQYEPGHWILHLPGIGYERRYQLASEWLGKVIR